MTTLAPACITERHWEMIKAHCNQEKHLEAIHGYTKSFIAEWHRYFADNYQGLVPSLRVESLMKTGGLVVDRQTVTDGIVIQLVLQDPNPEYYYCTLTRYIALYFTPQQFIGDVIYSNVEPYIARERRK